MKFTICISGSVAETYGYSQPIQCADRLDHKQQFCLRSAKTQSDVVSNNIILALLNKRSLTNYEQ
jgi:hypothetical protein